jgi:hypothetical protein
MRTSEDDTQLRQLIKNLELDKPDKGFADRVMDSILAESTAKTRVKSNRILDKKFWIFAASFVLVALFVMLISGTENPGQDSLLTVFFDKLPATDFSLTEVEFSRFRMLLKGIPATIAAVMTAASALILTDKFLGNKRSLHAG